MSFLGVGFSGTRSLLGVHMSGRVGISRGWVCPRWWVFPGGGCVQEVGMSRVGMSIVMGMSGGWVCPGGGYVQGWVCPRDGYIQGWVLAPPPPQDTWDLGYYGIRFTSGQCASYWNDFLLKLFSPTLQMQENPIYVNVFKCAHLMHLLKLFTSICSCVSIYRLCISLHSEMHVYFVSVSLVMILSCSWNVYYHKIAQSERTFLHFF